MTDARSKQNGHRNRGGWTKSALSYVAQVNRVLDDLRGYWPLTLRQVYYQLVAALIIENNNSEYKKLSRILAKARLDELVAWEAFEDRTRATLNSAGWQDKADFMAGEVDHFLEDYRRDLLQSQSVMLEVWIEKDALSRVCYRAAYDYCVPVIVARGFSSVSYVHECRKRVEANAAQGKRTVILYFGDLDPSGWEMLPSMLETLQQEMKLGEKIVGHRCALMPEQVSGYGLPRNPDALKATDSRANKYIKQFGDLAVELDALSPAALEALVRQAIESHLDLSQFKREHEKQKAERAALSKIRSDVQRFVLETWSG